MDGKSRNFIEEIIDEDLAEGKVTNIQTRFPPEPNGYLHLGHAASICLNFGLAKQYNGKCNLRFDDTNPLKEETEYVASIKADIKWLGFQWDDVNFTSDYFDQLYEFALKLIKKGKAYVDDETVEEIAQTKGDIGVPGKESPWRNRSVEENVKLFEEMKQGQYKDGEKVLRAKIDMAHPNLLMRDPIIYRIKHARHHRTGEKWCIYPMYDMAHGQSDSIEKVTHSLCTLEFIHHRPLYNWLIEQLEIYPSHQYEFAPRSITYTMMSKRRLLQLVQSNIVNGWDDPRMPTISGIRRRGYTPESIRMFAEKMGISKRKGSVDMGLLESCLRQDLNKKAERRMAVLDPVKLIITNYPEGKTERLPCQNNPEDPDAGSRNLPFSRELWIERGDFMEDAPKKFFRLTPGKTVRLKSAFIVLCEDFKKDEDGRVLEVYCKYFPESKSGQDNSGIKVKGTIHWVNAATAKKAEVHLYDRLFTVENPLKKEDDFKDYINQESLKVITNAYVEPALGDAKQGDRFQFMRKGYFMSDKQSTPEHLIFNRSVTLRDKWKKKNKGQQPQKGKKKS